MTPKGLIVGVLAVLFLIVLGQNTEIVTVRLLLWKISMSRIVLMLGSALVGMLVGVVLANRLRSAKKPALHKPG
ncbi:MAG: LapA family protein [candidate division Zixibacteria bacterium]|nr:LapA family protein [candidate division Zixibacteria bacterium]